ncbi:28S ribosomal protein S18b, mitochondrial isoform X2 [Clupea harengus]|uniref:Small ribosomal subunit protein mS40 n=1 Tax=Clupea harengus TaxID=7950 RepID=A0A6P8GS54_CLUHA|nr:28S ribosomal protein S18b, mitochondrial isoform X2 [Clupea harengus]
MAAPLRSIERLLCRTNILRQCFQEGGKSTLPVIRCLQVGIPCVQVNRSFCTPASIEKDVADTLDALSRYKDRPWDYLESEEYIDRYGSKPVWFDYRRNHKGAIPRQKTRKTCIRGDKSCGNPCPICRDPNVLIHYQNVKLLQQFVSPYTGLVLDPTRTGVCMKQQKRLNQALETARDHGLISVHAPHVDFSGEDYSNSHAAVGSTPPTPVVKAGESWYYWYGNIDPDERELARVKKIYKAYLKK